MSKALFPLASALTAYADTIDDFVKWEIDGVAQRCAVSLCPHTYSTGPYLP